MSVQELSYVDEQGKTRKKWRVRVKSAGHVVADQMFHKKGDADLWEAEQKRKLYLGEFVSPKAGKELLGTAVDRWRVQREDSVASKTYNTEGYALKHLEPLRKRPLGAVSAADLNALYASMLKKLSRDTVVRFRQIVSAFYSWAVSEKLVAKNPVLESKVPSGTAQRARKEIFPFTYAELLAVHAVILANTSKVLADIVLVLGLTGLRWGELAALRVRDVQELPYPALRVVRSKPDGQPVRNVTKGGKPRIVPLTADAAAIILPLVAGRMPDQLVFPSGAGGFRANNNFKRDAHWKEHGRGRRIHDLRHSAATIWLSSGVDLKTVQTWLGHSTAKLTADTYSHWMGTDADAAAVARLNALRASAGGDAAGTRKRKLKNKN